MSLMYKLEKDFEVTNEVINEVCYFAEKRNP